MSDVAAEIQKLKEGQKTLALAVKKIRKSSKGRQRYESAADLEREIGVVKQVSLALELDYRKATSQYAHQYDFFLTYTGKARAFVEVKCRNMVWGQYSNIMLSLAK